MRIIDEFFIKYSSNAKDVQKDNENAGKAVDGLEKKVKQSGDTVNRARDPFTGFKKDVDATKSSISGLSGALGDLLITGLGAFATFKSFQGITDAVGSQIDYNAQLERTHQLTGVSAADLGSLDSAFSNITQNKGEVLNWFSDSAQKLQALGLNADNIIPSLKNFADELHKLPVEQARTLFAQFSQITGLPADTFQVLYQGGAALQSLIDKSKEMNATTEQGAKDAQALEVAWANVKTTLGGVATSIGNHASGPLAKFLDFVNTAVLPDWLSATKRDGGAALLPGYETLRQLRDLKNSISGSAAAPATSTVGGIQISGNAPPDGVSSLLSNPAAAATINRAIGKGGVSSDLDSDPSRRQSVLDMLANAQRHIGYADSSPINSISGVASVSGGDKVVQIGSIVIQTPQGSSPADVAAIVTDKLNQHFRTTIGNNDDSIAK